MNSALIGLITADTNCRSWLYSHSIRLALAPEELLFRQGEQNRHLFHVDRGVFKLTRLLEDGREQITHLAKRGDLLGAPSFFGKGTLDASAIAMANGLVTVIEADQLGEALRLFPSLSSSLLASLAERVTQMTAHLERLTSRTPEQRVAGYLIDELNNRPKFVESFVLAMKKSDLAIYLGMTPETFSRSLKKLEDRRMIEVNGREIRIKHQDAILAMS